MDRRELEAFEARPGRRRGAAPGGERDQQRIVEVQQQTPRRVDVTAGLAQVGLATSL